MTKAGVRGQGSGVSEGWGWPGRSRKAHYFRENRSLCGQWFYTGPLEEGKDRSPDNCAACVKKLLGKKVAT